jgi:hypothetical protein
LGDELYRNVITVKIDSKLAREAIDARAKNKDMAENIFQKLSNCENTQSLHVKLL